jgi:hypothetical protein
MRWSLNCLLLYLLWILCGLICRYILCLLGGLSTELSTFKMKATLTNVDPTAPATPLCQLCYICNCPSYLCLCECSLPLLGRGLLALATGNLCQSGRTLVPITRCTPSILAANHTDQPLRKP